jgi:hypothetical protein
VKGTQYDVAFFSSVEQCRSLASSMSLSLRRMRLQPLTSRLRNKILCFYNKRIENLSKSAEIDQKYFKNGALGLFVAMLAPRQAQG